MPTKTLPDPVFLARNKLRMSHDSLEHLASFLGCNEKTKVHGDLWLRASLDGDPAAMDYIARHCLRDVLVLEKVVGQIKAYSTRLNSGGSGY